MILNGFEIKSVATYIKPFQILPISVISLLGVPRFKFLYHRSHK